jgi:hypothetical protein
MVTTGVLVFGSWAFTLVLAGWLILSESRRKDAEEDADYTRARLDALLEAQAAAQWSFAYLQERFERECA